MSKKTQKQSQNGFEPTRVALAVAAVSVLTLLLFAILGASR
jgi:hypothetical protein